MPYSLGNFDLHFDPDGKLAQLRFEGQNLLFEHSQAIDLGGGRLFRAEGWDECFPTIDPSPGSPVMGDLVGRPPEITVESECIRQTWRTERFTAWRCFSQDANGRLEVSFQAQNLSLQPLEYLWASHALFPLTGLESAIFPDGRVWTDFSLDGSEIKCFVANAGPFMLLGKAGKLTLETDQPWWGVWINRGGWAQGESNRWGCIGIEATNTPGEIPHGQWLPANTTFHGMVTLTFDSIFENPLAKKQSGQRRQDG